MPIISGQVVSAASVPHLGPKVLAKPWPLPKIMSPGTSFPATALGHTDFSLTSCPSLWKSLLNPEENHFVLKACSPSWIFGNEFGHKSFQRQRTGPATYLHGRRRDNRGKLSQSSPFPASTNMNHQKESSSHSHRANINGVPGTVRSTGRNKEPN